jgi:hypothetical protein
MSEISPERRADVQETIRHLPDLAHLRMKSSDWGPDEFEYARSRIDSIVYAESRARAYFELEQVRTEFVQKRDDDARHADLKATLNDPKYHWTTTLVFCIAVATFFVALPTMAVGILAWLFPRT